MMKSILLITSVIIISACNSRKDKKHLTTTAEIAVNNKSPLPDANVPFVDYSLEAERGDTIVHSSGSVLIFPKNSIVDASGKPVIGKVDLQYREFSNPLDIYVSGIPMNFDSAGKKYLFESAAMCEILATKNGVPVFINKNIQPQINLVSKSARTDFNLYYYDSTTQQWQNKGKDEVCDFKNIKNIATDSATNTTFIPPLQPKKPENNLPIINIKIETGSVPELSIYDNTKFQIDKSERNFNQTDAGEQ